jgi:hypothetical protein
MRVRKILKTELVGCWVRRVIIFDGAGDTWMWDGSTPGGTSSGGKVGDILVTFLRVFPLGYPQRNLHQKYTDLTCPSPKKMHFSCRIKIH